MTSRVLVWAFEWMVVYFTEIGRKLGVGERRGVLFWKKMDSRYLCDVQVESFIISSWTHGPKSLQRFEPEGELKESLAD